RISRRASSLEHGSLGVSACTPAGLGGPSRDFGPLVRAQLSSPRWPTFYPAEPPQLDRGWVLRTLGGDNSIWLAVSRHSDDPSSKLIQGARLFLACAPRHA